MATPAKSREIPPALIAAAVALVLILAVGVGYWFLRPPQETSREDAARLQAAGRANAGHLPPAAAAGTVSPP